MKTLVGSPFADDAAEILDCYSKLCGFEMRDRMYAFNERAGQAFMNVLFHCDPKAYARIAGSSNDPFYDDSKIPAALDIITSK